MGDRLGIPGVVDFFPPLFLPLFTFLDSNILFFLSFRAQQRVQYAAGFTFQYFNKQGIIRNDSKHNHEYTITHTYKYTYIYYNIHSFIQFKRILKYKMRTDRKIEREREREGEAGASGGGVVAAIILL